MADTIQGLHHHEWLEVASWVSQIAIAIFGAVTAYLVVVQVKAIAADSARQTKDSAKQTLQMKASFLFELDKLYESESFTKTRTVFTKHFMKVYEEIDTEQPHLDITSKNQAFSLRFCNLLHEIRRTNVPEYYDLMKFAGFFETAGKISHSGYADLSDVFDLYATAIIRYYLATSLHIRKVREQEGVPHLYEHFLRMGEELSNRKGAH